MKEFYLERVVDDSGVSGTGKIAEGVLFENGWCALNWLTKYKSLGIYPSLDELLAIHGHGGHTKVMMIDRDDPGYFAFEYKPKDSK